MFSIVIILLICWNSIRFRCASRVVPVFRYSTTTLYYYLIICFILSTLGCSTEGYILHNLLFNLVLVLVINLIIMLVVC